MNRPALEVADIFRAFAHRFLERSRARICWPQHKVMRAIERCRTAALGRHRDRCSQCWVVDVRKPFGGPEHVLHYLAPIAWPSPITG